MLIKLSLGLVYVLFFRQKNQTVRNFDIKKKKKQMNENETQVQQSRVEDKFLKSNVRNPRSKLLHLALLAWLGKEDRHSKGLTG